MTEFPLLIEFAAPSRLEREPAVTRSLPMVHNGPPGTFVVCAGGRRIPLPTDQIVFADDTGGVARVGFGGMRFDRVEREQLVFYRFRDVLPPEQLSPERGRTMTLDVQLVSSMQSHGRPIWPRTEPSIDSSGAGESL